MGKKPFISTAKSFIRLAVLSLFIITPPSICHSEETEPQLYVGSLACKPCHEIEYGRFISYAKKSKSFLSIERMQKGLNQDDIKKCYACHTTGYGKPGGFISIEETPHLKNAGCEVCHGPGERHLKSEAATDIKTKITMTDCEACHTSERIKAFRYKPIIHGGGH